MRSFLSPSVAVMFAEAKEDGARFLRLAMPVLLLLLSFVAFSSSSLRMRARAVCAMFASCILVGLWLCLVAGRYLKVHLRERDE